MRRLPCHLDMKLRLMPHFRPNTATATAQTQRSPNNSLRTLCVLHPLSSTIRLVHQIFSELSKLPFSSVELLELRIAAIDLLFYSRKKKME